MGIRSVKIYFDRRREGEGVTGGAGISSWQWPLAGINQSIMFHSLPHWGFTVHVRKQNKVGEEGIRILGRTLFHPSGMRIPDGKGGEASLDRC